MNSTLRCFTAVLGLAALPLLRADEAQASAKSEKSEKAEKSDSRELRVLAAPERSMRIVPRVVVRGEKAEKETVAFLGVITSPVSATLSAQLGLTPGSGLVVSHLEEKSPAEAALKEHDILLKLDDQLLVEQRQLSILIRQHKEGDEVTVTYIRGGKQATAKVKLGKHEVPKFSDVFNQPLFGAGNGFAFAQGGGDGKFEIAVPGGAFERFDRADVDHVLDLIRSKAGELNMRIEHMDGPGFRTMSVNKGNSTLSYSDDDGSLELTMKDDQKSLVAKNQKGEQVFAGPVNTPEERNALPKDVRARLEKVEGMHDMTFHTDGDFQGTETRLLRPQPRGIALPLPAPQPVLRPTLFF